MRLAEFALLVDADPKWVLNTRALLGRGVRYSVEAAERLALVRQLNREFGMPLPAAWQLAGRALAQSDAEGAFEERSGDGLLALRIDVRGLRAAVATRRSQFATMHEPRRAGRKRKRVRDPIEHARWYGLDLTLLQANLDRTPKQRIRQLDGMAAFVKEVPRKR
jgi:hypothetical protein